MNDHCRVAVFLALCLILLLGSAARTHDANSSLAVFVEEKYAVVVEEDVIC